MRARLAILLAGSVALSGCAYGYGGYGSPFSGLSVGVGYGSGYGGYGYGGYYGGCYDPYSAAGGYGGYDYYGFPVGGYGYGSCGGYGYGYGYPSYYGWNGGYYYPGTGYYVYDQYRRPHVWSDTQKRYWTRQRERALKTNRTQSQQQTVIRENWSGFDRKANRANSRTQRQEQVQRQRNRNSDDTRPQ